MDDSGGYPPRLTRCMLGGYIMRGGFLVVLNSWVFFYFLEILYVIKIYL